MTNPPPRTAYHHGNLRSALIDAGLELARSGGTDAVVLREVTRRVGVTAAAAYRHFANREQLLEAVAVAARQRMAAYMGGLMDEVGDGPAREVLARRIVACGNAYVTFALGEPGWFDIAFHSYSDEQRAVDDKGNPFSYLHNTIQAMVDEGMIEPERADGVELLLWASVHGYAMLVLRGPLPADLDERSKAAVVAWQREVGLYVGQVVLQGPPTSGEAPGRRPRPDEMGTES